MISVEILTYILIGANGLFSWQAFQNFSLFEKFKFRVGDIVSNKEYIRLLSSGFLHGDYTHLFVNMITLYFFAPLLGLRVSSVEFIAIYFGSLIAGNLLALFFNKDNYNYSAVGASGAVSGVVFACILFFPDKTFYLYFLLPIKAWIFGILYLLYTVYSMHKNADNIGHEAHLGGALMGVVFAIVFYPAIALQTWWLTALLLGLPAILFFVVPKKSGSGFKFTILNDNKDAKRTKRSIDDLYYNKEFEKEKELNALLEKVNDYGMESLSGKERKRLEELSK